MAHLALVVGWSASGLRRSEELLRRMEGMAAVARYSGDDSEHAGCLRFERQATMRIMPGFGMESERRLERCWRRLGEIVSLPFSFVGRRRILASLRYRVWPLTFPLAGFYRRAGISQTRIVAVIGSLGKTTTTRAVATALGLPIGRIRGWNAGGFLAEALLRIGREDRSAVLEVGIKNRGKMAVYSRLIKPDVVVVTSIASEHYRTLGSLEDIRTEKAEMVRRLPPTGWAILNGDDENVLWMRDETQARVLTYGFDPENDVWASEYCSCGTTGGRFIAHVDGNVSEIRTQLIGRHMVYPLLAALAVASVEGREWERAVEGVESLTPTPHRLHPRVLEDGTILLMDDYKATYQTIEPAMCALSALQARRSIAVLGTTFEPPGEESAIYRSEGEVAAQMCDRVLFIGPEQAYRSLAEGAAAHGMALPDIAHVGTDVHRAAALLKEHLGPGSVILLKACDVQRLERITLSLEGHDVRCSRPICLAPLSVDCGACSDL